MFKVWEVFEDSNRRISLMNLFIREIYISHDRKFLYSKFYGKLVFLKFSC